MSSQLSCSRGLRGHQKLMSMAFSDMNPFPMRVLSVRRALHVEALRAELSELQRMQREYAAESAGHAHSDLDTDNEDDA
ncbi:hypothetical protein AAFF_G00303520 [Aldrovandia affinis]|uniref:Uncharacterized protein n=1 Tax=Aldrovandia affinis TaxID=143900 RepID=A0AAD7R842_9TELE|nr:hypothetical protein AAFF_G00303520 [Aldrovandia affinis]